MIKEELQNQDQENQILAARSLVKVIPVLHRYEYITDNTAPPTITRIGVIPSREDVPEDLEFDSVERMGPRL
jgi:hypothetical protein